MADIIVTIPKTKIKEVALKAVECFKAKGRIEFTREYPLGKAPPVSQGDKIFVVEDGFIRGYFVVLSVRDESHPIIGTKDTFDEKTIVVLDIHSWNTVEPIAMIGFPNFKYAPDGFKFTRKGNGCFDLEAKAAALSGE